MLGAKILVLAFALVAIAIVDETRAQNFSEAANIRRQYDSAGNICEQPQRYYPSIVDTGYRPGYLGRPDTTDVSAGSNTGRNSDDKGTIIENNQTVSEMNRGNFTQIVQGGSFSATVYSTGLLSYVTVCQGGDNGKGFVANNKIYIDPTNSTIDDTDGVVPDLTSGAK